MGRINITLAIDSNDMVLPMEMDQDATVASLKEQVEGISGIPAAKQVLLREGKPITGTGSLKDAGMAEGDVIMLMQQQQQQQQPPQQQAGDQQRQGQSQMATNRDGSFMYPEQVVDMLRNSPDALANLRGRAPAVAAAIERGDIRELQETMRRMHLQNQLPEDPMDPEYQRRAMEAIQQQAIDENYENAMEHSPEMFGQVQMLYVDMTANGEPLKVFVDSGAQMTIMTQTCAEKCNLMRLVDKRFAGLAVGVGSSKISGRIHACNLKVGDQFITTSITVLEQKSGPQCIFGLDNMRRHQCCIDLPANALRIGTCGVSLPFLPEHEVPQDFNTSRQLDNEQMDNTADAAPEAATSSGTLPAATSGAGAGPSGVADPSSPATAALMQRDSAAAAGPAPASTKPRSDAPTTGGAGFGNEAAVKQLMDLTGQRADQCREALAAANNNIDAAASILMGFQ